MSMLSSSTKIYIYICTCIQVSIAVYIYIYGWMLLHFTMSQPCPLFWGSCKSNRPWSSSSSPSALSSLSVTGLEKYHDDELKECEAKNGYMMGSPIASGFFSEIHGFCGTCFFENWYQQQLVLRYQQQLVLKVSKCGFCTDLFRILFKWCGHSKKSGSLYCQNGCWKKVSVWCVPLGYFISFVWVTQVWNWVEMCVPEMNFPNFKLFILG